MWLSARSAKSAPARARMLHAAVRAAARAPLARCTTCALLAAAPARGLAAAPPPQPPAVARRRRALFARAPHTFFVQRAAGVGFAEVEVAAGASVAALVKAAVAELRLDAAPDAVTLSHAGAAPGAPPLDATLTLDAALAAGALAPRAKLLLAVRAEPLLAFRVQGCGGEEEAGLQELTSEAGFDEFVRGRSLWAVRVPDGGGVPLRTMLSSLRAARNALATPGVYLLLRDVGEVLAADVSNLKRAAKNASTSFEELSNKAAAADTGLRARYGALAPVNDGEEVVFIDARTGKDFASYDGLFVCARGVVFNEAKARLCVEDVAAVRRAHARLSTIVQEPERFTSRPAYVADFIAGRAGAGRAVVPLLSSTVCDAATAAAAAAARVHVLVKSGAGFACALAEGEYEAAADEAVG